MVVAKNKETLAEKRKCITKHDCGADYDGVGDCDMGYPEEDVKESVKKLKDYIEHSDMCMCKIVQSPTWKLLSEQCPKHKAIDRIDEIFGDKLI